MAIDLTGASKTSAAQSAASITAAAGSPSELFTKLLVAQIRNQDPLEPSDPGEFVNQLTQLSQMESLQTMSSQSSASVNAMESLQAITLGAQVGSTVTVSTDSVRLGKEKVDGSVEFVSAAASASVVLTGADGRETRIALGPQAAGETRFSIDPGALGLAAGGYAIRIEADGKPGPAAAISGTLSSVRLTSSGPLLDVTHVGQVSGSSITRFNGKQSV